MTGQPEKGRPVIAFNAVLYLFVILFKDKEPFFVDGIILNSNKK